MGVGDGKKQGAVSEHVVQFLQKEASSFVSAGWYEATGCSANGQL